MWLNLTQHGETYQDQIFLMTDQLKTVQDMIFGGAWPLVVRGLICHASIQITSETTADYLVKAAGQLLSSNRDSLRIKQAEEGRNNRSVMSFRCSGLHARYNASINGKLTRKGMPLP